MKDQGTKEAFVELRANGETFEEISNILEVSKTTLIKWSKELKYEINNYKELRREYLTKLYLGDLKSTLEDYGKFNTRLRKELFNRDLSKLSTDKLARLFLEFQKSMGDHLKSPNLVDESDFKIDLKSVESWAG